MTEYRTDLSRDDDGPMSISAEIAVRDLGGAITGVIDLSLRLVKPQ